jgi:sugar phosphate isomerase/epimerase
MSKIFLSSSCFQSLSYEDCLEKFKELNVNNIELSYNKYKKNQNKIFSEELKNFNLQIHNYFPNDKNIFFLNLSSKDDKIVKKSINKIHKNILRAKYFKVEHVSFHAGFLFDIIDKKISNIYNNYEYAMNIFKKNILTLSKIAKKNKINLLIENNIITKKNLNFFKFNPLLMTHPKEINSFFKWAPSNVKLLMDVGHFKVNAKTLDFDRDKGIKKLIKYIKAFQLSENNGIKDENKPFNTKSWFMPFLKKKNFSFYSLELNEIYKKQFVRTILVLENYLKKDAV